MYNSTYCRISLSSDSSQADPPNSYDVPRFIALLPTRITGYKVGLSRSYCKLYVLHFQSWQRYWFRFRSFRSNKRSNLPGEARPSIFTVFRAAGPLRLNHTPLTQLIYGTGVRLLPRDMRERARGRGESRSHTTGWGSVGTVCSLCTVLTRQFIYTNSYRCDGFS